MKPQHHCGFYVSRHRSDKFCDDGSVPRGHHKKPILNKQEAYGTYQLFQTYEAFDFISTSSITGLFRIGLCNVTNASIYGYGILIFDVKGEKKL